jgi:transposase
VEGTLAPLMAQAEVDPARPLYFVDATHPAYDAHPACGWLRRGETRALKSNHGRANVTMNGALGWPGREVVAREAEKITGPEMAAFFQHLAARRPKAEAVTVVLDNATYNRAATVRDWLASPGCRVRLVYLPPCAPDLNLIERLWRFFEKHTLWNRHCPTLADSKDAIRAFFADTERWKGELASLITDNFHFINAERTRVPAT